MAKKKKNKASKGKSKAKGKTAKKKAAPKKSKGKKKGALRGKKKKGGKKRKSQTFGQKVGARIRQVRESAGLSHAQFARKLKVAPPRVTAIESGNHEPKLSTVVAIARVLKTSVDYLAGATDKSPRRKSKATEEE